ncbi:type IV-A pilus assembly ATPase PilB [Thaumasiovibrio sp. DFM-14]|uniref:type IV-A pilus assembly ATPase PilB n=1 Tax=Thaumasiovibrio sp. DFM-14 TaxID=3384792 RepID=UPI00399F7B95
MNFSLLNILAQDQLLNPEQEQAVLAQLQQEGTSVPSAVVALGLFSGAELAQQLERIFAIAVADLHQYDYAKCCQELNLRELVLQHRMLPLAVTDFTLTLGISDPTQVEGPDQFRFATGRQIETVLLDVKQLEGAIRRLYGSDVGDNDQHQHNISDAELDSLVDIGDGEIELVDDISLDTAPVTRYINQVLLDAVRKGASDVHFEPYEKEYRIRFRCDGMLFVQANPPSHLSRRLSTRLKVMSKLNIAERRKPQDGRIKLKLGPSITVDLRVSTLPTLWGEKIVLRLLDSSSANLDINILGYNEQQKQLYLDALKQPQGMILVTGPTGSGKTVSLYTGLSILNTAERNISTAEDPVEINLPGINQVHINPSSGLEFSDALRAFLRQDPDVVMVGEIRDLETGSIAIKAAQTGHLVLSTLHTNSAAETITRLKNMGIASYNLASSLSLIIAQRLARRLCQHCKQPHTLRDEVREHFGIAAEMTIYQAAPNGCDECNGGYTGRVGIYEVMPFSHELGVAINKDATSRQLEMLAQKQGMLSLREAGIEKLAQGITSLSELQRVLQLD